MKQYKKQKKISEHILIFTIMRDFTNRLITRHRLKYILPARQCLAWQAGLPAIGFCRRQLQAGKGGIEI